jgi:hypothetical protein
MKKVGNGAQDFQMTDVVDSSTDFISFKSPGFHSFEKIMDK